jgi:hypothetical protein
MLRSSQSRRDWLRISTSGLIAGSLCRWYPALADEALADPARRKACILLWMTGGPSQLDTFDPKPGHANGGTFKPIDTSAPGVQICEHLPKVAQQMHHAAIIRSMSTKEGDHERATYLAHTGNLPQGPIRYPTLGSLFSKELTAAETELPGFVAVAPSFLGRGSYSPGFLGPQYAPLVVGDPRQPAPNPGRGGNLTVRNIELPEGIELAQSDARLGLLDALETNFQQTRAAAGIESHRTAYHKAVKMMRSAAVGAFSLDDEPAPLRDAYGRNPFGDACLLARRLVERGVSFVEVSLNGAQGNAGIGWDSHQDNFNAVQQLCGVLDPAFGTLVDDLNQRGLLDSTLVLWMGEFGRTPVINSMTGRDHFPVAWSSVMCGGGIRGGQVVGKTAADGMIVEDRPVPMADYLATVCMALGLDPSKQNMSNVGRPIRLADPSAKPITEIVG